MEFYETIKVRRSVRAYRAAPVEPEKLNQILEGINQAPSAGNLQAFEVYQVANTDLRSELRRAAFDQQFVSEAPVVLVFCTHAARSAGKYGARGVELYSIQDASIACTYAMLAATALGLSSVWVGAFDETEVSRILELPPEHRPVAMLPIGYAAEQSRGRSRRSLVDLVHTS